MRQLARISIITAVAASFAASLVPLPAIGSGCGSHSEDSQADPRAVTPRDPNLQIETLFSQYAVAGDQLQKDVSDLEVRMIRVLEKSGEAGVSGQLTEIHMQIASLKTDLSHYQDLGWHIMTSLAHQMNQQGGDRLKLRTDTHQDHDI